MIHRSVLRTSLVLVLTLFLAFPTALAQVQIPEPLTNADVIQMVKANLTTAQTRIARVISENANLRETPSMAGLAEGEVSEGTVVKILDEKLPWYVVRVGDRVGWMHRATLLLLDDANTSSEREPVRAVTPADKYSLPQPTRSTTDKVLIRGPRGGCYYISASGSKVYVDRSLCN